MRRIVPHGGFSCLIAIAALLASPRTAEAAAASDPAVDVYDLKIGTQTFAPRYKFTTGTKLVETVAAIRTMGSDVVKFYLGRDFPRQYDITLAPSITTLTEMVRSEPSARHALNMPFRHFVVWAYALTPGGDTYWRDGVSSLERQREYDEIFAFTRYLLTNYNNSGKKFYLGHWEGDWYLLPNYDTSVNPSATAIQGMIDWLNIRQAAVDEAKRTIPHTNVDVYVYTEANRVRDAMVNPSTSNQRLINRVVPYVTNLDYVSWSSYDGMGLAKSDLLATLNYMESQLPTNKAPTISGRRIFIGEYGWGGTLSSAAQEPPTRGYIQKLLEWGPPFILFWEMYNNEPDRAYWLIDSNGVRTASYYLHQRFYNEARLRVAEFKQNNSRLPTDTEFGSLMIPLLNAPLPPPKSLEPANGGATIISSNAVTISGTLRQGVYGQDWASVQVFWGTNDGGTLASAWANMIDLGTNSRFGIVPFSATISNVQPDTRYYYRFHATNSADGAWADYSAWFSIPEPPIRPATLVAARTTWKYRDDGVNPDAAWRGNSYDDNGWKSGMAQLGFGDGDETTPLARTNATGGTNMTFYFRRAFYVHDAAVVQSMGARLLRDDGAVVYLNGVEVWRENMPDGPVTYYTPASGAISGADETTWLTNSFSPGALVSGWNVVGVEVHQNTNTSSDVSFDFELTARVAIDESPAMGASLSATRLELTWPAEGTFMALYGSTVLTPSAIWSRVLNPVVFTNGGWIVSLPRVTSGNRFFRLQSN